MKKRVLMVLMGIFLCSTQAFAQQKIVTGKVTGEDGTPLASVSVVVKGTNIGTATNAQGNYSIRASVGQVLRYRLIGTAAEERTVGDENVINVQLRRVATSLEAVVVTSLGETAAKRTLGTAQQTVQGSDISATLRTNFVNALQGRVAGVDVTSTSGVPGASSLITIRGVSSISSSNQPLMIVDGLPIDNKTTNTANLASDAPTAPLAFNNRGVDFTNRAADLNPDDIESITVLKGPEAAALYGIDAANGAIVITTKRGRSGTGGFTYSGTYRIEQVQAKPEVQHIYGPSSVGSSSFLYFGAPYPTGTRFYDNVDGFFQTGATEQHNLAFDGAAADSRVSYHVSSAITKQQGVIPNSALNKVTLTGASQGIATNWLKADVSLMYSYEYNAQPFKGSNGPLIGLLTWPDTNNAKDWLTPAGTRQRLTSLSAASELDNPYFNVNKNKINARNNRIITNAGFTVTPFAFGYFKTNIGVDAYTTQHLMLRHPESAYGVNNGGILDINDDVTRNLNAQTIFNVNDIQLGKGMSVRGLVGNAIQDNKSNVDGSEGIKFLDPNFVSMNNTAQRYSRTILTQRRVVSAFGQATLDFRDYLYVNATGRNDWTSTIPQGENSFFYPGVNASFIFTDAFPSLQKYMTGKLRGGYAAVGRDAQPYSYKATLESKATSYGGYGYGFWGPNPLLKPEFAKSYEFGTELSFLRDRLGVDATVYRKRQENQIVQNVRESYGTGFILFNLNGATTETKGFELTVRGTPTARRSLTWDTQINLDVARGKTSSLPNGQQEFYNSDTWLYGNIRNGTGPGMSTMSLTGLFYLRNKDCKLLIDPTTGLPIQASSFIDAKCVDSNGHLVQRGYDRQPDFTIGLNNDFKYNRWGLHFLFDIRKGGDVFNATEHYLYVRGLAKNTEDRWTPRVIPGVLRDGKENTGNPTVNNIVVIPALNTNFYTNTSEEQFIERNINWLRLRDITLDYDLPRSRFAQRASLFVTATDVFLWTNYTGLDPIANGNDAAVSGSSGVGIDFANFPIPRGINFGVRMGW